MWWSKFKKSTYSQRAGSQRPQTPHFIGTMGENTCTKCLDREAGQRAVGGQAWTVRSSTVDGLLTPRTLSPSTGSNPKQGLTLTGGG